MTPIYEFECPRCGAKEEVVTTAKWEKPRAWCNHCQQHMVKIITPVAAVYKGEGWTKAVKEE